MKEEYMAWYKKQSSVLMTYACWGPSCQAGTGFLHQSREGWIVSDSCFTASPQKFLQAISSSLLARQRPGTWGRRAGTSQYVSVETHQASFITSPTVWLHFSAEAHLYSCQQAPSDSRKAYREKQHSSLCHIFLSPPFTTRMQISHSFSKWLHKNHINFIHISQKKSANC